MNGLDLRSSQSSYGDPRHFSAASFGIPQPPPTKVLLEGYRNATEPHNGGKYNPFNQAPHPHNSVQPSTNDPVAMYLLTETAMGDSANYDILSLEDVEGLKKEHRALTTRTNATKRKLALELKLRDAAMSLSRLHNSRNSRTSDEYDAGPPNFQRTRRSVLGRNTSTLDKTDEELALSNRKCEELAAEIWNLERRVQDIQKKLLEHTAGVLQLTHKGLKKNLKNGIPHTPESLSSNNTVDDFDDRSLYKPSDHDFGGYGTRGTVGQDQLQDTERKLEYLSSRMRDMVLQSNPSREFDQIPQPSNSGGPVNPAAMVDAHLAYIENGLGLLKAPAARGPSHSQELDYETEQHLKEISTQLSQIVENPGLPRSQTLPPMPGPQSPFSEQLAYLGSGINGLHDRVEKLLEQKSILTTQIQQQRELNSKSDAERDAHIADLVEQLTRSRRELELSEQEGQQSREELDLAMEQLEEMRQDLADHKSRDNKELLGSEKEARVHAEAEISRLQNLMQELQHERDEHHETRVRVESEVARLENHIQQLQSEHESYTEQHKTTHSQAEGEVVRLQAMVNELQGVAASHESSREEDRSARSQAESEVVRLQAMVNQLQEVAASHESSREEDRSARSQAESEVVRLQAMINQLQEVAASHENSEQQISQLEETIHQVRNDADARVKEANDMRAQAEDQISQLEASMDQLRADVESQLKEATEGRALAEENSTRLQAELTQLEGDVVRAQTELTMVKAELDGAYGTRAQRAAEAAASPALQKELDELNTRNFELAQELAALKAGRPGSGDAQNRVVTLEKELRETVDDYEAMTKASIEFEKEREKFEGIIDGLRDRCEQLETQLNEERISWMGLHNSAPMGRDGTYETTSTMVLKNEFKKMMRDTRAENMKILKAEHEERRRLEGIVRALKKEQANLNGKSNLGQSVTAL